MPYPQSTDPSSTRQSLNDYRASIDALDQQIVSLASKINAANYQLLVLVREFDERAGWMKWGLANCTQWLHWRCDISLSAAREKIRVAHALKSLPLIANAFESGDMSYSKVRALTRVADVDNEATLLDFALQHSASRVEEYCRQRRNLEPEAGERASRVYDKRSLRCWRDAERGVMTITLEVPIEQGELIQQALDKAIERESVDITPPSGSLNKEHDDSGAAAADDKDAWSRLQADAMIAVSRHYLAGRASELSVSTADQYQVVVHVDEQALTKNEGRSDLPIESVRRLCCDSSVVTMVDDTNGMPLNVGRKQRTIPPAIKRVLWARDKGCSFPGCTHTRFIDAHHVVHWSHGGETSLENLMLLCSTHHRLVHEGGFAIRKNQMGDWFFQRPDGRAVPTLGYSREDWVDSNGEVDERNGVQHDDVLPRTPDQNNPSAEGFRGRYCDPGNSPNRFDSVSDVFGTYQVTLQSLQPRADTARSSPEQICQCVAC